MVVIMAALGGTGAESMIDHDNAFTTVIEVMYNRTKVNTVHVNLAREAVPTQCALMLLDAHHVAHCTHVI